MELIKKFKRDKEEDEQRKQEDKMKKQTLLNQRLKEELKKRRIENGVPTNVNGIK